MEAACPMARRLYEKGQTIFRQGEPAREMGVVLSEAVHIESVDLWGHRTLLSHVGPGQVFGETYALTGGPLLVDAVAAEAAKSSPSAWALCWGKTTRAPRGRGSCCTTWCPFSPGRTGPSPTGFSAPAPRPSGAGLSRTFPPRPWSRAAAPFPSPLTGSSWRITWVWTAAPSPKSWAACGTRDCWRPAKTTSSSTGWGRGTVDKLPAFLYNHTRCVPPRPSSPAGSRLPRQAGISQAQGTRLISLYLYFDARKASASRGERMSSFFVFGRNLP